MPRSYDRSGQSVCLFGHVGWVELLPCVALDTRGQAYLYFGPLEAWPHHPPIR